MLVSHSILFGIVEGITEFLPISSTGHLILISQILKISQSDFLKSFEIIIQLGAILAVIALYWQKLFQWAMLKKLFVAFLPTAVIGLALYKIIKIHLLGNLSVVLGALFLGGLLIIIFEWWYERKIKSEASREVVLEVNELEQITYSRALALGFFQSTAIIPGVSRSAATIIGGLWLGLKRKTVVEFSFLLAVPTMLAATALDLVKNYQTFSTDQFGSLAIGFVVAFLVAGISIKFLLRFIRQHNFIWFGVYRIVIAVLFWFFIV